MISRGAEVDAVDDSDVIRVGAEPVPASATEHMVPMRDDVLIATDVYLPEGEGPWPAVLVRLPYDKDSRYVFFDRIARVFTQRGYAVVVQDVRGKFRSGGETIGAVNEAADGYDSIEWVSTQPWCNGVVGMFGDSYYGFTQWAAISAAHPALKAWVPRVTSHDLFATWSADGVQDVPWAVMGNYLAHYWIDNEIQDYPIDYSRRPFIDAFEDGFRRVGARSRLFDLLVPEPQPMDLFPFGHPYDAPPVPVMHVVGWFDNLLIVSMRDYEALAQRPGWAEVQYLWADSTDHENYHLSLAPIAESDDHLLDEAALTKMLTIYADPAIEFFDVFLKGDRPVESFPRVQWHHGHVGYREADSWPPPGAQTRELFLSRLADAAAAGTGGHLGGEPAGADESVEWSYDPSDLVPSTVENSFAYLHDYPGEQSLLARHDALTFYAEPTTAPVDLAGPVSLALRVDSSAPTADVFVKLYDVDAGGVAKLVARGQGTVLEPGADRTVEIGMGHVGYRLRPGHRFCLAVLPSDFPEFVPHPGTSENRWTAVQTSVAVHRIVGGAGTPVLRVTVLAHH